jgi:uncharacterized protein (TIGR03382 family)
MTRALRFCSLLLLSACAAPTEPLGEGSSPIYNGTYETGYPEVVFLYNIRGAACTATIVAPRLVLTAKHCVQGSGNFAAPASDFRVFVGPSARSASAQYRVQEVRPVPGAWDLSDGTDVAVLILSTPAAEAPREMTFDSPNGLTGGPFTAVGYGQREDGSSGTKFSTGGSVDGLRGRFIFVTPTVCSGDSGGPILGPDGKIWGVASFIYPSERREPQCGDPGAYNSIAAFQEFIEQALEDSGACVPTEEICDGVDNDCDGDLDEGCTPIGSNCSSDDECVGQRCAEITAGGGNVCTQECDPMQPEIGCPAGFFCSASGLGMCDGLCAPGAVGTGLIEDECTDNTDCLTGYCVDPGDGTQRCLAFCRGDRGDCLAGEVCVATAGTCGACVPDRLFAGPYGIGEPCDSDDECSSGYCFTDEGASSSSRPCMDDEACGEGFHCRDSSCVRGPREAVGGGCITNEDCGSGFCASAGGRSWCSDFCTMDEDCPMAFSCTAVDESTSVCAPELGLTGDDCGDNAECASGLCAMGTRAGSLCTEVCGPMNACSPGFECVRVDGGALSLCLPPTNGDGGGCAAGGQGGAGFALVLGAFALDVGRRRRR